VKSTHLVSLCRETCDLPKYRRSLNKVWLLLESHPCKNYSILRPKNRFILGLFLLITNRKYSSLVTDNGRRFHDKVVKNPLPRTVYRRRHHSTMKGYKNWCNAMTSVSAMLGTMSKISVQYVHQMAIYMVCNILFFLNSPSEVFFCITLVLCFT